MQTFATFLVISTFSVLFSGVLSEDSPISPSNYAKRIGTGFATNYFKTNKTMFAKKTAYKPQNIIDVYGKNFTNLRLRCRADLDEYKSGYTDNPKFTVFLNNLTTVVDKCIEVGVTPIISWIHHHDEAYATEAAKQRYLTWWTLVATHLKDKSYACSFNLFTELGIDACGSKETCGQSLRMNNTKYNEWTRAVVSSIRGTGGKNTERILILGSPEKTADDLVKIDDDIYSDDEYMMAEWHLYASGPNSDSSTKKYWTGDGSGNDGEDGRNQARAAIKHATDFTANKGLRTYLGAWMPQDNKDGSLTQQEVENFAAFFVAELKKNEIPSSVNVLDIYYQTKTSTWITGTQTIKGRELDMAAVLEKIAENMWHPNSG